MSANLAGAPESRARELRAGGTDLSERRRSGVSRGALLDLAPTPALIGIAWEASGAASIGALATIEAVAGDARIGAAYPGLAAAGGLATPQIRRLATMGGNLAQRSRCWYYRDPHIVCLKKGGPACPARDGNHLYGVAFDLGPCVAPHPSTIAAALLAYDATIVTDRRTGLTISNLLGDGSNGASDNALEPGETIQRIVLPPPVPGERALYKRAISRAYAEWPLAELVVRAVIVGGAFQLLRLSAGGVAPVPIRLSGAEAAAHGAAVSAETVARTAELSTIGATPLPMTAYKLDLLKGLVRDLLEQLSA